MNRIEAEAKEFDHYVSNIIDKQEEDESELADFTVACIDIVDDYINKAITIGKEKVSVINDRPVFKFSIKEYCDKFNMSEVWVKANREEDILTDCDGNEFVLI